MSTERLDRIEEILKANSEQIAANTANIAANSEQIAANTANIATLQSSTLDIRLAVSSLIETANQHQRNFEVIVGEIRVITTEIREIQSDIRGLRAESLRIQERLFGQQGNGA